jgi:hypothetical protein
VTTPGRLAAAPRGGSEPDRETRIGFGPPRVTPLPLATFGGLSPAGNGQPWMWVLCKREPVSWP